MGTEQAGCLYRCAGIPVMQNVLHADPESAAAAPCGCVELVQGGEDGLVFNRAFAPSLVQYDAGYQNDQSLSPEFRAHFNAVGELLSPWVQEPAARIVDVGCGKGAFVEFLRSRGLQAIGYDNAYEGDAPYIRKRFFGVESHEKGALLLLRHVLEHIPTPWAFLSELAEANGHAGYLYIEVPDLEWILEKGAFFDIFHEHVNYFRLEDFQRRYGTGLVHAKRTFGGQYLSLVLNLACLVGSGALREGADGGTSLAGAFQALQEREASLYRELEGGGEILIWGAAAKGVTFCSKAPRSIRAKIRCAIDINPGKQNHFMPVTAIPVLSPEIGLATLTPETKVVIANSNYEREIRSRLPPGHPCLVLG